MNSGNVCKDNKGNRVKKLELAEGMGDQRDVHACWIAYQWSWSRASVLIFQDARPVSRSAAYIVRL